MNTDFEFDVAFSFLGQDEALAIELNKLLKGRVTTFLYSDSDRQIKLAGRDGEAKFNEVFGETARTVVVLYRAGWGDAGFTAVEATAIRNRAYESGYEFTTFIPLDEPPIVPQWLPKTRLWVGLKRWGAESAATVIESRVSEAGGAPRQETAADMAAEILREREFAGKRVALLNSPDGVSAARVAFDRLKGELERICADSSGLIASERIRETFVIKSGNWRVVLSLEIPYTNTLNEATLHIGEQKVRVRLNESADPRSSAYEFDLGPGLAHGWRYQRTDSPSNSRVFFLSTGRSRFVTTEELAETVAQKLLQRVRSDH